MLSTSINSDSTKRARVSTHPRWRRLVNLMERHEPIVMTETIPYERLRAIADHEDYVTLFDNDSDYAKFQSWIQAASRGYEGGYSKRVAYEQINYVKAASKLPDGIYSGSVYIGRVFTKTYQGRQCLRCQGLKKIIRNTLLRDDHYDIDIANCHPTIAAHLFRHLDIPALKNYVENRDAHLNMLEDISRYVHGVDGAANGLPATIVKQAVSAILSNAGPTNGFFGDNMKYAKATQNVPFFQALRQERNLIYEAIKKEYPGFYQLCVEICKERGSTNVDGKAFCLLVMDVENECIRAMVDYLRNLQPGRDPKLILVFDGIIVPKDIHDKIDELVEELEDAILKKVGIEVKLAVKPMEPFLEGCVMPDPAAEVTVINQSYEAFKIDFEKQFYKLLSPTCYARVGLYSTSYYPQSRFVNEVCAEYDTDLVKEWVKDKNKRKYERENFCPPPLVCPASDLNTFKGLRVESLPPVPDEEVASIIKPVLYHVGLLSGGIKANTEYFLNYLAFRFQFPGKLPLVGLGFRSVEGTGKDTFFQFIGNKMLGSEYFTQSPDIASLFGDKHSTQLKDKLLVVVSECSRQDTNGNRNKFKSFITAPVVKFRPLYVDEMSRNNYAAVVMFSQDQQFISLDGCDRRFCVMDSLPLYANNPEYFNKFCPILEKDETARAFYQFLMARDISNFKISADRPLTTAKINMTDFSARPFYLFLKEMIPQMDIFVNPQGAVAEQQSFSIERPEMYERYRRYIEENFSKYSDDLSQKRKFMSELRTLVIDSTTKIGDEVVSPCRQVCIRGTAHVKILIEPMMAFLKKYVPDDGLDLEIDEDM